MRSLMAVCVSSVIMISVAAEDKPKEQIPLSAERSVLATVRTIGKAREAYVEAARKEQDKLIATLQDEVKKETKKGNADQAVALRTFSERLKLVTLRRLAELDTSRRPAICSEPTMAAAIELVLKSREAYHKAVAAEQEALVAILEKELKEVQEKGNLERTAALKTALDVFKSDAFRNLVEADLRKRPTVVETKEMLIGTWAIELPQKQFKSEWTFFENGTVLSSAGAARGNWRLDLARNRILITWGGGRAESLNLPLEPELTLGESWHGKDVRVEAKKKDPLVD